MPWEIEREVSALHVRISHPVADWPSLFDGVRTNLSPPLPHAVYLPSRVEGGTDEDAEQLRILWDTVGKFGIVVLPPA